MDVLLKLLREHLITIVALLVIVPLGAISARALLWHSEREVLWHGAWTLQYCRLLAGNGGTNCIGQYELSFGNTGRHTELVLIDWPVDLRHWSMKSKVLNISAERQRANDPEFSCKKRAEETNCAISDFAAGTLLIITFRCLSCDQRELQAVGNNLPTVSSEARVYASDPRATLLFRRLGVFFGWF